MSVFEYVKQNWKKKTIVMMVNDSGFKESEIRRACISQGIEPIKERDFKEAVVLYNYEKYTAAEISEKFAIGIATVYSICKEWGIECLSEMEHQQKERAKSFVGKFKSSEDRYLLKKIVRKYAESIDNLISKE